MCFQGHHTIGLSIPLGELVGGCKIFHMLVRVTCMCYIHVQCIYSILHIHVHVHVVYIHCSSRVVIIPRISPTIH